MPLETYKIISEELYPLLIEELTYIAEYFKERDSWIDQEWGIRIESIKSDLEQQNGTSQR